MGFDEALVRAYLEKKGITGEKAEAIIEALKEGKDEKVLKLQQFIDLLGQAGDSLSKLPPEARQAVAPVVASTVLPAVSDSDDLTKLAVKLKLVKEALRDEDQESGVVKELKEKIAKLEEFIQEVKEEKDKEKMQALLDTIDQLRAEIDTLREQLNSNNNRYDSSDPVSVLLKAKEEANRLAEALKALGFDIRQKSYDINEVVKELERMGYKVERKYITPEELEKLVDKIREEERKKLEKELEIDKERIQTVGGIIRDVINTILGKFADAMAEAQKESLRERLRKRIEQKKVQVKKEIERPKLRVRLVGSEGGSGEGGNKA